MSEFKDDKKLYLSDDQDLIDFIDAKSGNAPSPWDQQRVGIRATLRMRKTFQEFSNATNRFSLALVLIGLVQICVIVLQYVLSVQTITDIKTQIMAIVALFVVLFMLWFIFRKTPQRLEEEEKR